MFRKVGTVRPRLPLHELLRESGFFVHLDQPSTNHTVEWHGRMAPSDASQTFCVPSGGWRIKAEVGGAARDNTPRVRPKGCFQGPLASLGLSRPGTQSWGLCRTNYGVRDVSRVSVQAAARVAALQNAFASISSTLGSMYFNAWLDVLMIFKAINKEGVDFGLGRQPCLGVRIQYPGHGKRGASLNRLKGLVPALGACFKRSMVPCWPSFSDASLREFPFGASFVSLPAAKPSCHACAESEAFMKTRIWSAFLASLM